MLLHHYLDDLGFTTTHSLIVIVSILGLSIFTSLLFPEDKKEKKHKIAINEDNVE